MPMPSGIGVIDLMLGLPDRRPRHLVRLHEAAAARPGEPRDLRVPGRVHVQGRPRRCASPTTTSASRSTRWTGTASSKAMIGVARQRRSEPRAEGAPRPLHRRAASVDPNQGMEARARARSARTRSSASRRPPRFPAGCFPQVPINDKKFYPIYAKCVELDIPIFVLRRRARARASRWRARTSSCIDEVCWFFPELKFVTRHGCEPWDRPRGEADAQVAEPLLLDVRLRAEALPEGDHRLRQHARRRQDHLRRLLPDGALARAHLRATCPTCRSRTTSGRSSCARTPAGAQALKSAAFGVSSAPGPGGEARACPFRQQQT